jgi:hypothetical protein
MLPIIEKFSQNYVAILMLLWILSTWDQSMGWTVDGLCFRSGLIRLLMDAEYGGETNRLRTCCQSWRRKRRIRRKWTRWSRICRWKRQFHTPLGSRTARGPQIGVVGRPVLPLLGPLAWPLKQPQIEKPLIE